MLLHDELYLDAIITMFKRAQRADVAVAFWGAGSESVFKHWNGGSLRIVCNLALGGTNPEVIPKLQQLSGVEVRQLDFLHAKLILTDLELVLGSANISINGLGLESGEAANFKEVGLKTNSKELRDQANLWFEQIWHSAREITEQDLEQAHEAWNRRRSERPLIDKSNSNSLLKIHPDVVKDRSIYFVVYRCDVSKKAREASEHVSSTFASETSTPNPKLDVYQDWEGDSRKILRDPDAILIPVYWGVRGKVEIDEPQRPIPELEQIIKEDDEDSYLEYTVIVSDVATLKLPFSFSKKDHQLVGELRTWLTTKRERFEKESYGFCIPVHEFVCWYLEHRR